MKKAPVLAIKVIVVGVCSILLLAGCGNSKPEDSLIKACELLNRNLISLGKEPILFKATDSTDKIIVGTEDLYFVTNLGNDTRQGNKMQIQKKYPFLTGYLDSAMDFPGNLDNVVKFKILVEAIKNTGFKISLTQSEINSIKGNIDDPSADLVNKERDQIIGVELRDKNDKFIGKSGCAKVSDYKFDQSQEDSEKFPYYFKRDDSEYLWSQAINAVDWSIKVVALTNICQKDGNYLGNKCARDDYVSNYDDSLPAPTLVDPWSRSWSSRQQEEIAKTVWCINNGYRNYIYSKDVCTNTISR